MTTYIGNKPTGARVRDEYIGLSPNGDSSANAAGIPYDQTGRTYILGANVQEAFDNTDIHLGLMDTWFLTSRDRPLSALLPPADLNDIDVSGFYDVQLTELNRPADNGTLHHIERNLTQAHQVFYSASNHDTYYRARTGTLVWTTWEKTSGKISASGEDTVTGDLVLENEVYVSGKKLDTTVMQMLGVDATDVILIGGLASPVQPVNAKGTWNFQDAILTSPFDAVNADDLTRKDYVDGVLLTQPDIYSSSFEVDTDIDLLTVSGFYRPITLATNTPSGLLDGVLTVIRNNDNCLQEYVHTDGRSFVRNATAALTIPVWSAWEETLTVTATDAKYIRKDQSDTMPFDLTFTGATGTKTVFTDLSGSLDNKHWEVLSGGWEFSIGTNNDAGNGGYPGFGMARNGDTVDEIYLECETFLSTWSTADQAHAAGTSYTIDTPVFNIAGSAPVLRVTDLTPINIDQRRWASKYTDGWLRHGFENSIGTVFTPYFEINRVGTNTQLIKLNGNVHNLSITDEAGISAKLILNHLESPLDRKQWGISNTAGLFEITALSDIGVAGSVPLSITRSGNEHISSIDLVSNTYITLSSLIVTENASVHEMVDAAPSFIFRETDGGLDMKEWSVTASGNVLSYSTRNDVRAFGQNYMEIIRSGVDVDKITLTGSEIVLSGDTTIQKDSPIIFAVRDTWVGTPLDTGRWETLYNAGQLEFRVINDAYTVASTYFRVNRTTTTVDKITLTATDVDIVGNLLNNGVPLSGGGVGLGDSPTWTGLHTFRRSIPTITMYNEDAGASADSKRWDLIADNFSFKIAAVADLGGSSTNPIAIFRTGGVTATSIQFSANILQNNGETRLQGLTRIWADNPMIEFYDGLASLGNENWQLTTKENQFRVRLTDDVGTEATAVEAIAITRSALTADRMTLRATDVDIIGNLLNNGAPLATGTSSETYRVLGADPRYYMEFLTGNIDGKKIVQRLSGGGGLVISFLSDDELTETPVININRSGMSSTNMFLTAADANFSGNLTADGTFECSNSLRVSGLNPIFSIEDTDALLDEKEWQLRIINGEFGIRTMTDAGGVGSDLISTLRTGIVVDKLTLKATDVDIVGNLLNNGVPITSGTEFTPVWPMVNLLDTSASGNWANVDMSVLYNTAVLAGATHYMVQITLKHERSANTTPVEIWIYANATGETRTLNNLHRVFEDADGGSYLKSTRTVIFKAGTNGDFEHFISLAVNATGTQVSQQTRFELMGYWS